MKNYENNAKLWETVRKEERKYTKKRGRHSNKKFHEWKVIFKIEFFPFLILVFSALCPCTWHSRYWSIRYDGGSGESDLKLTPYINKWWGSITWSTFWCGPVLPGAAPPFWSDFSHKKSHFWTPGTLDRCLERANMALNHALACIGVWYGAQDTFQVGRSSLEQPCHFGLVLAIKRVIFGPPPAIDRCTERPKKVPHHLSYVWGRFRTPDVPVSIVTVTRSSEKMVKIGQNGMKISHILAIWKP